MAIPRLDRVPLEHRVSAGDMASIVLSRTLLEVDIALAEDWVSANHDARAYVLVTLDHWIAAHGGDAIKRRFDFYATLSDCLDEFSERKQENQNGGQLYLTIDPGRAAYVVLRPTLHLLDEANPRMPTAFFHLFTVALNNWLRVYDYRDAQERVAMLRDWIESEEDQDQYQYEIPDL